MFTKWHHIFLISISLALVSWQSPAGKPAVDATVLRRQIAAAHSDTARISKIIQLGSYYIYFVPLPKRQLDSAEYLAREAMRLSLIANDYKKRGYSYDLLSRVYQARGKMVEAIDLEHSAIKSFQHTSNNADLGYAYKQLAGYYSYADAKDLSRRITYTDTALQFYLKSNEKFKLGETYQEMGNLYGLNGQQYLAIRNLKEGIAVYNSINYKAQQGLYNMLNECFNQLGDYNQAVYYGLKALQLSEDNHDTPEERSAINNHVGITYTKLGQFRKAAEYFGQGLAIAKANHDQDSYNIIAVNYSAVLSNLYRDREAIALLKTVKPNNDNEVFAILDANFLRVYAHRKEFDLAAAYYAKLQESIPRIDKMSPMREIAYTTMVTYDFAQKKYNTARSLLKELQDLSVFNLSNATQASNEHWLFKIDSAQGRYVSAIKHSQRERRIQDTLINNQKNRNIAELEIVYETEKKAKELSLKVQNIQLLTKQTQLQHADLQRAVLLRKVTIGGIIMMGLLLAVSYSRYRIKQRNNLQLVEQQQIIAGKNIALETLVSEKDVLLMEREWLLKEIHHRVKNNLQIVISLLNSQMIYIDSSVAQDAIRESQHRMHSISLIHQKLYQSDNLARIDMDDYIKDLIQYLTESFDLAHFIDIIQEIEPISLDVVQAVPIGLILNEAITNAIKYAFLPGQHGTIFIGLDEPITGDLLLTIRDNGKGLPADFDTERCSTLGMSMIQGLTHQLHGRFSISSDAGVKLEIIVPGYLNRITAPESTRIEAGDISLV
jgi:two-component system, sensor histidine kinase PdtaS